MNLVKPGKIVQIVARMRIFSPFIFRGLFGSAAKVFMPLYILRVILLKFSLPLRNDAKLRVLRAPSLDLDNIATAKKRSFREKSLKKACMYIKK